MGFTEDLAKAQKENELAAAVARTGLDALESSYSQQLAEFNHVVQEAVSALVTHGVPSKRVVKFYSDTFPRYTDSFGSGWYLTSGLCLFDNRTWQIDASIITREQIKPDACNGQYGAWRRPRDWENLGDIGILPGESAIQINKRDDGKLPKPEDCSPTHGLLLDVSLSNSDSGPTWVPLRLALIHGVSDLLTGGTMGHVRLLAIGRLDFQKGMGWID
ncbi:hypothetical protein [Arthrobacter sp. KNU40]|uniref:hypothetical protein n=1 Tax=Arthrobacter sp. KNU40 TaxID=3447965 RepID=UPI003F5D694C